MCIDKKIGRKNRLVVFNQKIIKALKQDPAFGGSGLSGQREVVVTKDVLPHARIFVLADLQDMIMKKVNWQSAVRLKTKAKASRYLVVDLKTRNAWTTTGSNSSIARVVSAAVANA